MPDDAYPYRLPTDSAKLRQNNFDLLRLLFAGTVCLVHVYELSGYQELAWVKNVLSSAVAVKSFFVVSGFLIFMSYERSGSILSYSAKRARRIYPAYFTVVTGCAIGLCLLSTRPFDQYFSMEFVRYVTANLTFLNFLGPSLPGVFEGHRFAAVNGALWTLKIEVMFYAVVPLCVYFFRRFGVLPVMTAVYIGAVGYTIIMVELSHTSFHAAGYYLQLSRQLPGQMSYFMAGAFFYYFFKVFERHTFLFLTAAVLILFMGRLFPGSLVFNEILYPMGLATGVVFCGMCFYLGNFGKYGDFSYGVYIIHFPLIQSLLVLWPGMSPWTFFMISILLASVISVMLWHLVEKHFLLKGSHYRITARQAYAKAITPRSV